jgi:S-adenosylmethionine synthetase
MIRVSEMVLPGHPDKFCDQVADAVVAACYEADDEAYCQVEVSAWSDQVWLSGGIMMRNPLKKALADIVVQTGLAIGYTGSNWVDARRYKVASTVCQEVGDPLPWSRKVNDQAIVIGYAGYDPLTRYLPPEHFVAHAFREALTRSCKDGVLAGHGPDGKLLVRLREDAEGWRIEHILVTLQQKKEAAFLDVCVALEDTLRGAYDTLRERDPRWRRPWAEVELSLNPNGPLINGGSDGDNGQTGRKLVMDYYGPRVPLGGGALSGKHLTHIDRLAAYAARDAAVQAVASGAKECLVRLCYAPNVSAPLDVDCQVTGKGVAPSADFFDHDRMRARYPASAIHRELGEGLHFYAQALPWNAAVLT